MPRLAKGARAAAPPGALLVLRALLLLALRALLLLLLLLLVLLAAVLMEPRPPPRRPLERGWEGREAPPRGVCVFWGGDTQRLSPQGWGLAAAVRSAGEEGEGESRPPSQR